MTALSAMPEAPSPDPLPDDEVAALLPYLAQLRQARLDQQEALTWLAEHADEAP
jgi:hypothetical protein